MDFANIIKLITEPQFLISTFGLLGVILIIFFETGFIFGFFFPGDSLLFTAGLLASQNYLNIYWLLIGVFVAAVAGDNVGYAFGKRVGPTLFTKEESLIFSKKNVVKAQEFYDKYGVRTIILARFLPVVRTFAPILAGVGKMKYSTFFKYNIIGGLIWTGGLIGLGYGFGRVIPDPDRYLLPAILVIIVFSAFPAFKEIFRRIRANNKETHNRSAE